MYLISLLLFALCSKTACVDAADLCQCRQQEKPKFCDVSNNRSASVILKIRLIKKIVGTVFALGHPYLLGVGLFSGFQITS